MKNNSSVLEENYVPQPSSKDGDLKYQDMITRILSTRKCVTMIQYIKFDQNPSFHSRDMCGNAIFVKL